MNSARILRLTARCDRCGARPRLRTFADAVELLSDSQADPEMVIQSYECHVRSCAHRYDIKVKHFQGAA